MRKLLLAGALVLFSYDAHAASYSVGAVPVQVLKATPGVASLQWLRIFNASPTGGAVLWCTREPTTGNPPVAPTPGVNTAGSYAIPPGWFEEFHNPGYVPGASVYCIATGGTGTAAVTVDSH